MSDSSFTISPSNQCLVDETIPSIHHKIFSSVDDNNTVDELILGDVDQNILDVNVDFDFDFDFDDEWFDMRAPVSFDCSNTTSYIDVNDRNTVTQDVANLSSHILASDSLLQFVNPCDNHNSSDHNGSDDYEVLAADAVTNTLKIYNMKSTFDNFLHYRNSCLNRGDLDELKYIANLYHCKRVL